MDRIYVPASEVLSGLCTAGVVHVQDALRGSRDVFLLPLNIASDIALTTRGCLVEVWKTSCRH